MHRYITKFEELCEKLVGAEQTLTESQKLTFFLHGIKDPDYDNLLDSDITDFASAVTQMRKKAIRLSKAGAKSNNGHRRNNNRQSSNQHNDHDDQSTNLNSTKLSFPSEVWAMMSPEAKKTVIEFNRNRTAITT